MRSWFVRGFLQALLCAGLLHAALGGVIVVTTTADSGGGSLRWAVQMTLAPGPDSICFAIPVSDAGHNGSQGTWTIRPLSSLPAFSDGRTTIDGTSQAKYIGGDPNPNGPEIEINAELICDLPLICVLAPEVTVRGLTLNMSKSSAIMFDGVQGGAVYGCYIGTTSDGMKAAGNSFGVGIHNGSRHIVIGDIRKPENGNLISGNQTGVFINGSCAKVSIIGNRIGTNRTGSDTLGGQEGGIAVYQYCDSVAIFDNLIGGNSFGIILSRSTHTFIETNFIGTDDGWAHNLGNSVFGILVADSAHDNWIGSNVIAGNHVAGIQVSGDGTVRNRLSRNLISGNGQKGIRIEAGGNDELQAPTILSVTGSSVSGTAGPGNTIEVYGDSLSQGRYFLGEVHAGADGAFALSLVTPIASRFVTATATSAAGNTSEFSPPHPSGTVAGRLLVTTTADTGTGSLRWAIENSLRPGPDSILFAIPVSDPGHDPSKGTWTIRPKSTLRAFLDGRTVVDGTYQAKFVGGDPNPYGPEIEIAGDRLDASSVLVALAPDVVFRGLTVNRATYAAFEFNGATRGGVFGCYIGTKSDGMSAAANFFGVWIVGNSQNVSIGDSGAAGGNLISGCQIGIMIQGSSSSISVVRNRIGVNREGSDTICNKAAGIDILGPSDSVRILGNMIGGSKVGIEVSGCTNMRVEDNSIGTDKSWTHALSNKEHGIVVGDLSYDNSVADNWIGHNTMYGIFIASPTAGRNHLARNVISQNGWKGIAHVAGANAGIAPPTVLSATGMAVSGTAGPGDVVEVFADDSSQGRFYLGTVAANQSGVFVLPVGSPITLRYITATATDSAGNTSEFSEAYAVTTLDVKSGGGKAAGFALLQNYPNPFNPSTTIRYGLPQRSHVRLVLYNILGQQVALLVNDELEAGYHDVKFDGSNLPSGVYLYRMRAGSYVETRRLTLVR